MAVSEHRNYRMGQRAAAAAETERRILAAAEHLFFERPYDQVRLEDVAAAAGVSSPTVIHRFKSKEELALAAATATAVQIRLQRAEAPVGDVTGAIATLVDHYEAWADSVLHLLSQEAAVPIIRKVTDSGRRHHAEWVERVFSPWLPARPAKSRARRLALLMAVTDIYIWKILRRDRGLSRAEAEAAMVEMVWPFTGDDR